MSPPWLLALRRGVAGGGRPPIRSQSLGPLCGLEREFCTRCARIRIAVLGARSAPKRHWQPVAGSAGPGSPTRVFYVAVARDRDGPALVSRSAGGGPPGWKISRAEPMTGSDCPLTVPLVSHTLPRELPTRTQSGPRAPRRSNAEDAEHAENSFEKSLRSPRARR